MLICYEVGSFGRKIILFAHQRAASHAQAAGFGGVQFLEIVTVVQVTGRDKWLTYCIKANGKIKTFTNRNTGEGWHARKICA
jgi:hypothetical protein